MTADHRGSGYIVGLRLLVFSDSNISIAFKSQGHVAWLGFVVSAHLKMISFSDNLFIY